MIEQGRGRRAAGEVAPAPRALHQSTFVAGSWREPPLLAQVCSVTLARLVVSFLKAILFREVGVVMRDGADAFAGSRAVPSSPALARGETKTFTLSKRQTAKHTQDSPATMRCDERERPDSSFAKLRRPLQRTHAHGKFITP